MTPKAAMRANVGRDTQLLNSRATQSSIVLKDHFRFPVGDSIKDMKMSAECVLGVTYFRRIDEKQELDRNACTKVQLLYHYHHSSSIDLLQMCGKGERVAIGSDDTCKT